MTRSIRGAAALGLAAVALAAGCSSGPKKLPVHKVSGQVLYRNKPVPGLMVVFQTADGQKPPGMDMFPNGRTDGEGRFQLTSYEANDGAPAGRYKVVLTRAAAAGEDVDPERNQKEEEELTLGIYSDPSTSGLTAEVKAGENTLEPFHLK